MKSRVILFCALLLLWFALSGALDAANVAGGILVSVLISALFGDLFTANPAKFMKPSRYLWFFAYIPYILWDMIAANARVITRMLHPQLPLSTGIIRIRTSLRNETALTFLANTLTLVPGSMTIDVDKTRGLFYVHYLDVPRGRWEESVRRTVERYEKLFAKIFEQDLA